MNDWILSVIRTWVPVGVGTFLAWLVTLGVDIAPADRTGVTAALTGIVIAGYYGAVRALEKAWPGFGILLGHTAQPSYRKAGR